MSPFREAGRRELVGRGRVVARKPRSWRQNRGFRATNDAACERGSARRIAQMLGALLLGGVLAGDAAVHQAVGRGAGA